MEAFEFLKEAKRMCLTLGCCSDCNLGYGCAIDGVKSLPDIVLESNCLVVEQWSKDHPIVTNAQKFKEIFGLPAHCMIDQDAQWWDEPYKEP